MSYQAGDRVALVQTSDPYTRLTPGTAGTVTGYDGRLGQLAVAWDDGSTLSMLLRDGDQVRLIAPARPPAAASLPGSRAGPGRQDITDPATGGSRLLSRQCATCILRHGDPMHLGPERLREIIGQALASGSFVVCHDTLTYGDFPGYGPAICRGFYDAYRSRSPALILLQAFRRLVEVPPPEAASPGS